MRGVVELKNDSLLVRFPRSKERFQRIKRFRDAEYRKELRAWVLPLLELPHLVQTEAFSPSDIRYSFDLEGVLPLVESKRVQRQEAETRLASNPFSIEPAILEAARWDVRFSRLSVEGAWLIHAELFKGVRLGSYLDEFPGAFRIGKRDFIVRVTALRELVKYLRDHRFIFGIEKPLADLLAVGQSLREAMTSCVVSSLKENAQGVLYPAIDHGEAGFSLEGVTDEELKILLPSFRGAERRRAASRSIDSTKLAKLVLKAVANQIPLYFTERASQRASAIPAPPFQIDGFSAFKLDHFRTAVLATDSVANSYSQAEWVPVAIAEQSLRFTIIGRELFAEDYSGGGFGALDSSRLSAELERDLEQRRAREEALRRSNTLRLQAEPDFQMRNEALSKKLFDHQRSAVQWFCEREFGLLGDDMGLGKTLSVIAAFNELQLRSQAEQLLVICPNTLMFNWASEIQSWVPEYDSFLVPKGAKQRRAAFSQFDRSTTPICICNYEAMRIPEVHDFLLAFAESANTLVCFDESQRLKNPSAKTFLAARKIAEGCERRVLLSGTPLPRDLCDIWSQMYLLDRGERFGRRYYDWLGHIAELGNKFSEFAIRKYKDEPSAEAIRDFKSVLMRRKKEEVVNLPEKIFSNIPVEMSKDQEKRYREICEELLLRTTEKSGASYVRPIESLLEEFLRAVQIGSNPRLVDPHWTGDPAKFVALDEIISEVVDYQKGKLIVWTNFLTNVDELLERFKLYGAREISGRISQQDKQLVVEEFQDGESDLRVLVAVPAAAGVGLTLTAANVAVYLDKTWNAEHWLQSIDRIHRIGQTGTVNILSLEASPIDRLIASSIARKSAFQEKVLSPEEALNLEEKESVSRGDLVSALKTL